MRASLRLRIRIGIYQRMETWIKRSFNGLLKDLEKELNQEEYDILDVGNMARLTGDPTIMQLYLVWDSMLKQNELYRERGRMDSLKSRLSQRRMRDM